MPLNRSTTPSPVFTDPTTLPRNPPPWPVDIDALISTVLGQPTTCPLSTISSPPGGIDIS